MSSGKWLSHTIADHSLKYIQGEDLLNFNAKTKSTRSGD